ncbi:toll/interleukin-1 receptor domain-containing protein [Saccharothrix sp. 6-C]|uniref:TIR domain-containing protein n=1 Tax=Saccharothrix sp. 6-C TaxID=2781735 RepID=UPI001917851D|nr:TIR domain-containing protein [Saccharothrix sp. 6-C]QQQ78185.1 toll/interleukin-1 receptor domain-containing protein [Saccharothrix sp. 6-C]
MPDEVVFVNYRQNELRDGALVRLPHVQVVEAVTERLRRHFGADQVFLDTGIRAGEHYPSALRDKLAKAELLVVVLHRSWSRDLEQRTGSEGVDWVRHEIRTALDTGTHVLPVLIDQAGLPDPTALPEDIRPVALKQSRRIDFGHWERDVRLLIQEVEHYVSPVVLPVREEPAIPAPRRWAELPLAWSTGALLPFAVITALMRSADDRTAWLIALAGTWVFLLLVIAGTSALAYWGRHVIDLLNREYGAVPHNLKLHVLIGVVIASIAILTLGTLPVVDLELRMAVFGGLEMVVIVSGAVLLRASRVEITWPRSRLKVDAVSVVVAFNEVSWHLDEFAPQLNRLQREQACFALDLVEDALTRMRESVARSRLTWLRAASPWITVTHGVLAGSAVGTSVAALATYWATGYRHWSAPIWFGAGLLSGVAFYLMAIEAAYRLRRSGEEAVLEKLPAELARLRTRVEESSIPPPPARSGHPNGARTDGNGHYDHLPVLAHRSRDEQRH